MASRVVEVEAPVKSWDEFSRLREVVVGDASHSRIPDLKDVTAWLNCYPELTPAELKRIHEGTYPSHVIDESNEDLDALVSILRGVGIVVHQPPSIDHAIRYGSPHWQSTGRSSYCPRDLTLILGETIIECPSPMRARQYETLTLHPLFVDYFRRGARWISAPRPKLTEEVVRFDCDGHPLLSDAEPLFEAANVLRLGNDLFYQVSRSGNEMGLHWLEQVADIAGGVRVHPLRQLYDGTHIDSTISFIRPGLVLFNPERVNESNIPPALRTWDAIWCPPMTTGTTAVPHTLSTPWIGMNLLMLDTDLAIVDENQRELISTLEHKGITVIPHRLRHSRVLGGGFHCVTLDILRDGEAIDYLN